MNAVLLLIQALIPAGTNAAMIEKIIAVLVDLYPIIVRSYHDLVPVVKNIITALRADPSTIPEQIDALDAFEAKLDADYEESAALAAAEDASAAK